MSKQHPLYDEHIHVDHPVFSQNGYNDISAPNHGMPPMSGDEMQGMFKQHPDIGFQMEEPVAKFGEGSAATPKEEAVREDALKTDPQHVPLRGHEPFFEPAYEDVGIRKI